MLALGVSPLAAQDAKDDMSEGMSLLQQGTRLLFEGLMKEMGPVMLEFQGQVIDLSLYHLPEILPNGDIIIRRKLPVDEPVEGEIDL